jgi:hypothetical protein
MTTPATTHTTATHATVAASGTATRPPTDSPARVSTATV